MRFFEFVQYRLFSHVGFISLLLKDASDCGQDKKHVIVLSMAKSVRTPTLSTHMWSSNTSFLIHVQTAWTPLEVLEPGRSEVGQVIPTVMQVKFSHARLRRPVSLWTWLCASGRRHDKSGKIFPPNCCHNTGNAAVSETSLYAPALRFPRTGTIGDRSRNRPKLHKSTGSECPHTFGHIMYFLNYFSWQWGCVF